VLTRAAKWGESAKATRSMAAPNSAPVAPGQVLALKPCSPRPPCLHRTCLQYIPVHECGHATLLLPCTPQEGIWLRHVAIHKMRSMQPLLPCQPTALTPAPLTLSHLQVIRRCPVHFEFSAENKGFEGIHLQEYANGTQLLVGLCEGAAAGQAAAGGVLTAAVHPGDQPA
jgi:hypothetical protein